MDMMVNKLQLIINIFINIQFHILVDPEKIQRVKDLYEELLIPQTYAVYEEESYKIILTHIQQISSPLSHELFFKILEKIYRRNA